MPQVERSKLTWVISGQFAGVVQCKAAPQRRHSGTVAVQLLEPSHSYTQVPPRHDQPAFV